MNFIKYKYTPYNFINQQLFRQLKLIIEYFNPLDFLIYNEVNYSHSEMIETLVSLHFIISRRCSKILAEVFPSHFSGIPPFFQSPLNSLSIAG